MSNSGVTPDDPADVPRGVNDATAALNQRRAQQSQLLGVRFLALLYSLFFVALAVAVLVEGLGSEWWSSPKTPQNSVLVGISSLSDFVSKAMAFMNFVFGFGGGIFATPVVVETGSSRVLRKALFWLTASLIALSLAALWSVAFASQDIANSIPALGGPDDGPKPRDVVATLGLLNLSIAGGFLVGLAVPGAATIFGNRPAASAASSGPTGEPTADTTATPTDGTPTAGTPRSLPSTPAGAQIPEPE